MKRKLSESFGTRFGKNGLNKIFNTKNTFSIMKMVRIMWDLCHQTRANEKIPIYLYKSKRSPLRVAIADVPGPMVKGLISFSKFLFLKVYFICLYKILTDFLKRITEKFFLKFFLYKKYSRVFLLYNFFVCFIIVSIYL